MKEYYAVITDENKENYPSNWTNEKIRSLGIFIEFSDTTPIDWANKVAITDGMIAHLCYINVEDSK